METRDKLTAHYEPLLQGTYDCVDRLVLNAYCPLLLNPGGLRYWYRQIYGEDDTLSTAKLIGYAGKFSKKVQSFCKQQQIPLIYCKPGERKHDKAEALIPKTKNFTGIFAILVGRSMAPLWEVKRFSNGIDIRRKKKLSFVNHYHFHIIDKDWGHITIKMCAHPPFSCQIMLNGHEWLANHPKVKKLAPEKQGNCFVDYTDADELTRHAETLKRKGRLAKLCDRWIYKCLWFGLDYIEQQKTAMRYNYSIYQVEYSRNLLFKRGRFLDQVYQGIINLTRPNLDIPLLKTMFGSKKRPYKTTKTRANRSSAIEVSVQTPDYNLTIFKIHFGKLTVKLYDKGERTLRAEVVVHNVKELRCKRSVSNFKEIVSKLQSIMNDFMNNLFYMHHSMIEKMNLNQLAQPVLKGKTRLAGINLTQQRMTDVLQAVLALSLQPKGYAAKDLSQKMQQIGWEAYSPRMAAYDLKKLRAKEFVTKASARKYKNTPMGIQNITALLALTQQQIPHTLAIIKNSKSLDDKELSQLEQHHFNINKEIVALNAIYGIQSKAA